MTMDLKINAPPIVSFVAPQTEESKCQQDFPENKIIPKFIPKQMPIDVDLPTLQNIVATANLNSVIDLKHIAIHCQNVEYKPKRFAAAIMRIREPKSTALIF